MRAQFPNPKLTHLIRLLTAFLAALATAIAFSGAAAAAHEGNHDGDRAAGRTWTVQVGSESHDQAIQGMAFLPGDIYINQDDTVTWKANSAEIHTVTFLAAGQELPPFDPFDPMHILKQGGNTYSDGSYFNSGIMANVDVPEFTIVEEYSLTFPDTGEFTYYCLVHGVAMKGTVHVAAKGSDYPYSQRDYNNQARKQERTIVRDGLQLWAQARDDASSHKVIVGADDETAMLMRFVREEVHIKVGEQVTFVNNGMGAPHTVTFGAEPANVFAPVGDPTNFAGGQLNSGLMLPQSTFTITFTKAGTYDYICALHDYMGMIGTVVVEED